MLSLHYNGSNISLFFNASKIYQFKEKKKDSEISKGFSVHYNAIDTNDILMYINI